MNEVTVNKVRAAVNKALGAAFTNIKVYSEEIKQDLNEPAFFVKNLSTAQESELGRRYKRYHAFDIHYFPKPSGKMVQDMNDIAEILYQKMELIPFGTGLIRGHNLKHEDFGGILHFFVDYDLYVERKKETTPKMERLTHNINVKEDLHE